MNQKKNRYLAFACTAVMVMGAAAGMGNTVKAEDEEALTELTLPLCEEKQELSVWIIYNGSIVSDLNEIAGVQKMEEMTNVHINWTTVNQEEQAEKYGTLIASNNYPDIIYAGDDYPGGFEVGIEDGVVYPDMDGLIKKCMPNYMSLLAQSDEARREATADSGKMLVCRNITGTFNTVEAEGTYTGLAYRADILEDLGLDVPTTVDEWHDALVAAKEAGISKPFELSENGASPLCNSWGVMSEAIRPYLQLDGDTVVCSQYQEGYGEYLKTMRQWFEEGLIDPNFTTFNFYMDTPASVNNNETLLYSNVISSFAGNSYAQYNMVENKEAYLQPISAPPLKEGESVVQGANRQIANNPVYITTSCEDPELAAKWLDFQYSKDGILLNWYGIEGETYEFDENGEPQFTEMVTNPGEGVIAQDLLQKYALNQGSTWLGKNDISASQKLSKALAGGESAAMEAVEIWSAPEINVFLPGAITLTEDESFEASGLMTTLKTMIDEYTISYIVGETDEDFESFRTNLEDNGLDIVLEIYQAAYDRYLAR